MSRDLQARNPAHPATARREPYAHFESARTAAQTGRSDGVSPAVAHKHSKPVSRWTRRYSSVTLRRFLLLDCLLLRSDIRWFLPLVALHQPFALIWSTRPSSSVILKYID